MKRTIKFRGLRTDGKGWVYGVPYYISGERKCFIIDNCQSGKLTQEDSIFQGKEVEYKSVGQFTGLKDKNGVEIYEGDLLSDRYEDEGETYESLLPIVWCSKTMQWCVDVSLVRDRLYLVSVVDYFGKHLEIKGNIHDKSETK